MKILKAEGKSIKTRPHHWTALQLTHSTPEELQLRCLLGGWKAVTGFSERIINTKYCSKLIFTIPDVERNVINILHLVLPNLLETAVDSMNSCFQVPCSLESPSDVEKNVIQHSFFFISYTLRWNRCSLWGGNVFLCWLLYTVPVPWREIPQTHTSDCTGLVLLCPLPFWPLWPWCCLVKSVLVWCLWPLCWMCLCDGCSTEEETRQQRIKSGPDQKQKL